jgi:hypothetical protein
VKVKSAIACKGLSFNKSTCMSPCPMRSVSAFGSARTTADELYPFHLPMSTIRFAAYDTKKLAISFACSSALWATGHCSAFGARLTASVTEMEKSSAKSPETQAAKSNSLQTSRFNNGTLCALLVALVWIYAIYSDSNVAKLKWRTRLQEDSSLEPPAQDVSFQWAQVSSSSSPFVNRILI